MKQTGQRPSVAVVVPFYRDELPPDEELSLLHLETFLGDYPRYLLAPESLRPQRPGFRSVLFEDRFFRSVATYSRLLLSREFYRAFSAYRFILIYQLDSLVFRDDLAQWCSAGYDYVGAPWVVDPARPELGFHRVGNGGFSLRRVDSCLSVLDGRGDNELPWRRLLASPLPDIGPLDWRRRLRIVRDARRGVAWYRAQYSLNEDRFWSDRARLFDPDFRVAPVKAAMRFALECAPRYGVEQANGQLPFGCHAWAKWDREFWLPHLLRPPRPSR